MDDEPSGMGFPSCEKMSCRVICFSLFLQVSSLPCFFSWQRTPEKRSDRSKGLSTVCSPLIRWTSDRKGIEFSLLKDVFSQLIACSFSAFFLLAHLLSSCLWCTRRKSLLINSFLAAQVFPTQVTASLVFFFTTICLLIEAWLITELISVPRFSGATKATSSDFGLLLWDLELEGLLKRLVLRLGFNPESKIQAAWLVLELFFILLEAPKTGEATWESQSTCGGVFWDGSERLNTMRDEIFFWSTQRAGRRERDIQKICFLSVIYFKAVRAASVNWKQKEKEKGNFSSRRKYCCT